VNTDVWMEIEKLRRATLGDLRAKHREVFQEETSCRNRNQLFRRIAWRLQALAEGDLTDRARQRAQEIARDADLRIIPPKGFLDSKGATIEASSRYGMPRDQRLPLPGTRLSRQWRDKTIVVEVLVQGFRYENRLYSSLSAIASAVTGTRWNGLAFFGLTGKSRSKGAAA
jgi:Protein of unknown function (DUF2924)